MKPQSTTLQDLFEVPETLPKEVQDILEKYCQADTYEDLNNMLAELKPLGYTFEYYLDAIPFNLTKLPAPISREVEGFTPGEWEFNQEENTVSKYRIYSTKDGRNVGWFDYDEETKESELANVTLIASAPTLYRENQQQAKDIEELKNGLMIAQNYIENFIAKGGIGEAEKDLLLVTELINRLK